MRGRSRHWHWCRRSPSRPSAGRPEPPRRRGSDGPAPGAGGHGAAPSPAPPHRSSGPASSSAQFPGEDRHSRHGAQLDLQADRSHVPIQRCSQKGAAECQFKRDSSIEAPMATVGCSPAKRTAIASLSGTKRTRRRVATSPTPTLGAFLSQGGHGPEQQELLRLIGSLVERPATADAQSAPRP